MRQITLHEYEAEVKKQEGVVLNITKTRPDVPASVTSYVERFPNAINDDLSLAVLVKRIRTAYPGIQFFLLMGDGRAAFTSRTKMKTIRTSYSKSQELHHG